MYANKTIFYRLNKGVLILIDLQVQCSLFLLNNISAIVQGSARFNARVMFQRILCEIYNWIGTLKC